MGKASKRVPGRQSDDAPMVTIGDLRKRLRSLGNPWEPDPALSDDEPIPQYPTGGDEKARPPGELAADANLDELLSKLGAPPSNPDLREVWREEGLLGKGRRSNARPSSKRDRSGDQG
jgi:hypothetical protein